MAQLILQSPGVRGMQQTSADLSAEPARPVEELEFFSTKSDQETLIRIEGAEVDWVEPPLPLQSDYPWCPVPWRAPLGTLIWLVRTAFSLLSLWIILAVVAAIPIVNFLALGYLLEVEARVARSGRLLAAFPLLNQAGRLGVIVAGIWVYLLPLRLLSGYAVDAELIEPGGPMARGLRIAVFIMWTAITLLLLLALARGGTLGSFVNPLGNALWLLRRLTDQNYLETAGRNVQEFVKLLQLRMLFWQGLQGFGVAFAWLLIPTVCFAALREPGGLPVLVTLLGGLLLVMALMWAPFLQVRYATARSFRAGFQLREIRDLWQYAPLCWTLALLVLYALALPLYVFKIVLLPRDAMWLMTLAFIASIYPTRIATGWAYGCAVRRRQAGLRAHWLLRALCGWVIWPLMGIYVFILFFTQFIGAEGKLVLFAHHALLLPAPFFLTLR